MSTIRLTLTTPSRDTAYRLSGALTELMEPAPDAVSVFEAGGGWQVDGYFGPEPDNADGFVDALYETADVRAQTAEWGAVPEENWVAISQSALPPVFAGRFIVHGSHDRDRLPNGPWTIEIDAGEAFGTAHHATTYGCLEAIGRLPDRKTPRRILDLGTGSGVLAIAAARRFPAARIIASDLDADSVRVAAENVAKNQAAGTIRCMAADGVPSGPDLPKGYDLAIANILAGPLITMAGRVSRAVQPRGTLILSGILTPQAAAVLAAYRAHGMVTVQHRRIEGWSTLTLKKRSGRAKPSEPLEFLD
jgi:ribosomal protein L11 methyltransferase